MTPESKASMHMPREVEKGTIGAVAALVNWAALGCLIFLVGFEAIGVLRGYNPATGLIDGGIFIGSTSMILLAEYYLKELMRRDGLQFFRFAMDGSTPQEVDAAYRKLFGSVWNTPIKLLGAALYTGLVAGVASTLYIDPNDKVGLYLFTIQTMLVCIVPGSIVASLTVFVLAVPGLTKQMKVNFWQLKNPTTVYLLTTTRTIAVAGGPYIAIGTIGIMFCPIHVTAIVWVQVGFSILIFTLAALWPYARLIEDASKQKSDILAVLNRSIAARIEQPIEPIGSRGRRDAEIIILEQLMRIRNHMDDMAVLPFKRQLILSIIAIIISGLLPVFGEYALDMISVG